jgi:flagellar FliL protein
MSTAAAAALAKPAEETPPPPPKKFGMRKLILLAVPLLLAALLSGLWFSGILPRVLGLAHEAPKTEVAKPLPPPVFVDLPEMVANLNGTTHRTSYVKLVARLELARLEDVERVRATIPRLQDMFQTYLRERRPEELRGSAGTYRLREELIARGNIAVAPARIIDVLFTQLLVQ